MTTARSKIITDLRDDALMSRLSSEFTGTATIFQTHTDTPNSYRVATNINLDKYDVFCVFTSGGKDSLAALKVLLDAGVPKDKIEMHHHLVDGRESNLMDWDFMESYNLKVAKALGIKIYMSWLQGGFEGEMLKENSISQPCAYETPNGLKVVPRTSQSKPNTRRKFPQQSGQLRTRWCSSVLKIQLGSQMITSQERFKWKKVLYVSGRASS